MQELIAVGAWYIWWLHRRQTHGEQVPPLCNCTNFITAVVANSARANTSIASLSKKVWLKPGVNYS
jgi:hypothetical protein